MNKEKSPKPHIPSSEWEKGQARRQMEEMREQIPKSPEEKMGLARVAIETDIGLLEREMQVDKNFLDTIDDKDPNIGLIEKNPQVGPMKQKILDAEHTLKRLRYILNLLK